MTSIASGALRARAFQAHWAATQGIEIDAQAYTLRLNDNLFQPLTAETRAELARGAGSELGPSSGGRGKLQALHGSAALVVNVFDYWRDRGRDPLARALGLAEPITSIQFERTFPTTMRGTPPHLDVTITTADGSLIAIESKFLEPYAARSRSASFRDAYFPSDVDRWAASELPLCQTLAESLRNGESVYCHVDAEQLLKHALGLASSAGEHYSLWYLWYDVGGDEGNAHRAEIEQFAHRVDAKINFRADTYQALIARLAAECGSEHSGYVAHLRARYGRVPAEDLPSEVAVAAVR
jgi:hypothetical protein